MKHWVIAVFLVLVVLLSGGLLWDIKSNRPEWLNFFDSHEENSSSEGTDNVQLEEVDMPSENSADYEVVPAPVEKGLLPMSQRTAVLGLLNKRTGQSQDLTMRPGNVEHLQDITITLRACEETMPWENEHLTGAFVQIEALKYNHRWQKIFSGWLYKEAPALNVVESPDYDVWPKSCTMRAPLGRGAEKDSASKDSTKNSAASRSESPSPKPALSS
ncbi:Protein of unknown function DUF2155 [Zymomonas mobilis subsp. pomaceae ATCC 29192]|uniref:DUF2155 domain-containing protein n=1 Tax=Zymomonas mobilis subsp. pomaceae (strain ATCC 29192 / DSM 22645 / JCM 10191 / CCUG 17912 / NBRC 13757 / NCIMB 11200 / NRRL B-4491 / Barker I) TaxID=579138 RepID=F8EUV6_ZYMMT|nr:Protein of unknown function DUF2155 [Zymomonas mobilis subsp. pomaceae ATCC 29192]